MSSIPHTTQQPTPYESLLALPENLVGEIIDGELHTQPRPSGPHGLAESGLNIELGGPYHKRRGGPGGWWIIMEPEVHFEWDIEVVVPDLAGWRRERMPAIPQGHRYEVVPDWVCEILSPDTIEKDRGKKLPLYARHGVAHAWFSRSLGRNPGSFRSARRLLGAARNLAGRRPGVDAAFRCRDFFSG